MVETAEPLWTPRSAWHGLVREARLGIMTGQAGVVAVARAGWGIAMVIAFEGGEAALAAKLHAAFGLTLPRGPSAVRQRCFQAIWTGPGQWLVIGDDRPGFREALAGLAEFAAVSDQSDSRAVLALSGARVRDLLAKGCMIDLHPSVFPVGAAASTSIAHIGVTLWRVADGPDGAAFELMVPRSLAGSFWSWFTSSAAEFGCEISTESAAGSHSRG